MGMREWHWGSGRSSSHSKTRGRATQRDITTNTSSASTGCMCAVFQLFDFHQLQLANLNHHHHQPEQQQQEPSFRPQDDLTLPKGVEAPRNSLDSSEGTSLSSITKEEDHYNSPILKFQMGMQIKTSARSSSADFSSDMINSPGTKTPNLVARLMGLDLLPDQPNSPSSTTSSSTTSKTKSQLQSRRRPRPHAFDDATANGTRSLPDTPRISLARKSDVDYHHHRLSLQINKENIGVGEDLDSSYKRRDLKMIDFGDKENGRSPRQYARQIVKQVKESVTRKVGLDITNTTTTRSSSVLNKENKQFQSKDELLQQLKSKKAAASNTPSLTSNQVLQVLVPSKPKSSSSPAVKTNPKPKSGHDIGYGPKLMMMKNKKKEEAFVHVSTPTAPKRAINHINNNPGDKKCNYKKTHLLLSSNNVPTLLPIKKDPSPPATKLPLKQQAQRQQQQALSDPKAKQLKRRWSSQLSCSTSQQYKQQVTPHVHVLATRDDIINFNGDITNGTTTTTSTTAAGGASSHSDPDPHLHQYVTRILTRTGIDKHTQVSFTNWFSPSHPLDPSIFYHLEISTLISTTSQVGQRCNRKLLFHLVDEILVDILRPYINLKPLMVTGSNSHSVTCINGSQLINMVCYKIQSFPGADCRALEDIDALIDKDMPESKEQSEMAFEEEGEGIVREVEKDILDTLIHEAAMALWF